MVRKLAIILILMAAALPAFASAGNFTATVDRNAVAVGESFTLDLALSNAQARGGPNTEPLGKSFIVASQGQSSNTTIINGNVTSSTGWELTLIPRSEGKLTIPPVSIETTEGTLSTQPITMDVGKAAALPTESRNGQTTITAKASTLNPYKGQPIFYTVKIVAHSTITDLSLGDLKVENAIVESSGKPKILDEVENGAAVKVIEARYIITPLASGKITIPAMLLQGRAMEPGHDPFADVFGQMNSDPFGMLQHMNILGGFASDKPFSLASNDVQLDVKPAAAAMDPWLPLISLKISENWDGSQSARVGEPLTRKITLVADGAVGKQLPSLDPQQNHSDFKVYADKPVTEESIKGETIIGTRKESYSLIPLKPGKLTLPEIRVKWWDIRNNRMAYATLPARTMDVLPALVAQGQAPVFATQQSAPVQEQQPVAPLVRRLPDKSLYVLYAVIGMLALSLLCVVIWGVRLQRKSSDRSEFVPGNTRGTGPELMSVKNPAPDISDLAAVRTTQELAEFIRGYANEYWGTPKNAPLEIIFSDMASQNRLQKETAESFTINLVSALYAGKDVDMEGLKKQCAAILHSVRKARNDSVKPAQKLPKLNPY